MPATGYSLSDLLMFTPEVYLRLFVRFNEAVWPLQLLALAAGLAIPVLLTQRFPLARRLAVMLLALAWIATGLGFMGNFYAPINWPVGYFGFAFVAQAMLVGAVAGFFYLPDRISLRAGRGPWLIGFWLASLLGLPWLTVLATGQLAGLAVFGMTPDVTATASVAALVLLPRRLRWLLLVIPLVWCLFSTATLYALNMQVPMLVPLAGVVMGIVAVFLRDRSFTTDSPP